MTTLSIARLTATVPEVPSEPGLRPRLEAILAGATARRLDQALEARPLPEGHWFVRRLTVRLPLDLRRADPGLEQQWADAVTAALHEATATGQAVHYGSDCDALADLVACAAVGRFDHEWAWRQLGLIDELASGSAGRAALTALGQHPEFALAAMTAAVCRAGVAAVHRLFGALGWRDLAGLVYQVHCGRPAPAWLAASDSAGPDAAACLPEPGCPGAAASGLAARLGRVVGGELARCFRQSRLRPDPATVLAWAVLAAAASDPGLLMLPAAESAVMQLAAVLLPGNVRAGSASGRIDRPGAARPPSAIAAPTAPDEAAAGQAAPDEATAGQATAGTGTHAAASVEPGVPAEDRPGWPSEWAGLLHLFRTAAEAGIPAAVLADDALSARPLGWVLYAIAGQLVSGAPDDPALLAFAGLLPDDEPPTQTWPPAGPRELNSIARCAHRWLTVTAQRLTGDGEATAETTECLLHRRGTIFAERGWIEIEMSLDTVNIAIRRAGLDIDPGWIGWLGSVLRFRYV